MTEWVILALLLTVAISDAGETEVFGLLGGAVMVALAWVAGSLGDMAPALHGAMGAMAVVMWMRRRDGWLLALSGGFAALVCIHAVHYSGEWHPVTRLDYQGAMMAVYAAMALVVLLRGFGEKGYSHA